MDCMLRGSDPSPPLSGRQVKKQPGYHATTQDVLDHEARYGPIEAGSVVFIRSDWSKKWHTGEVRAPTLGRAPGRYGASLCVGGLG